MDTRKVATVLFLNAYARYPNSNRIKNPLPPSATTVKRWLKSQSPDVEALRDCFRSMMLRAKDGSAPAIAKVESLRQQLLTDDRVLKFYDFGAGNPGNEYSQAESTAGVQVERRVSDICRGGGLKSEFRAMIYYLILGFRPKICFELGTSLGLTAAYIDAALSKNGSGRLVTLDGAVSLAQVARQNLESLGCNNVEVHVGRFQDTLDTLLQQNRPVDFAFIDGHHDGDATVKYFEMLQTHLSPGSLIVLDDLSNYASMKHAWKRIRSCPKVAVSLLLGKLGICIYGGEHENSGHFDIPLKELVGVQTDGNGIGPDWLIDG